MGDLLLSATPLAGVMVVRRSPHIDARGSFARLFCADAMAHGGWSGPVVQINHSATTARGTVRGIHYQLPPHAEKKLVSCVRGRVWDVVVDLRRGSPTFLQWHGQELSPDNGVALLVPEGCAHGFQAMSDDAELVYCHSQAFAPLAQRGIHPCEARLAIAWPLPVGNLSQSDSAWPTLGSDFEGVST
jgi:dTDP-4-dehydrorhamnose 3,5-epimerase